MLNKVIDFLKLVYHNYMSYVAVGIVLLAVIVVALIIFIKVQSNKLKSKRFDNNDQNAVTSLTPEEIDNISNNVADPDKLLEYISETNEKADAKKKKSAKKTTKQATKSKSSEKEKSNKDKPKEVAPEVSAKPKKETQEGESKPGFGAHATTAMFVGLCGAYIGDLLSWVMGRAKADNAWITIMSSINVIAVATLADVSCIILAEGVEPDSEVSDMAMAKGVNILSTPLSAYDAAVRLSELI